MLKDADSADAGGAGPGAAPSIADVLPPVAVDTAYSYRIPDGLALAPGDVVAVPLGPRLTYGVVWSLRAGAAGNLKAIDHKTEFPPLTAPLRHFVDWVARYTLSPRGSVLAMALKTPDTERPEAVRVGVRHTGQVPSRVTPARARVIAAAMGGMVFRKSDLAQAASCSSSVIDGLVDDGVLETIALPSEPIAPVPDPDHAPSALATEQRDAANRLVEIVRDRSFQPVLLEGVTGSGKTEVYFEAVAEALRAGRQALILMPEIALTAQFLDRFAARFGVPPALWHSGIAPRRRERLFAAIATGEAKVVAGARSALFLPYRDLGLIVVDEEHEAAYKQEDGVLYNARDMAVKRADVERVPVILASATPSLETKVNAQRGRYRHLNLPTRYAGRPLPHLAAIDLRRRDGGRGEWISTPLAQAIEQTLASGEQALLFLNRRGFAPLTLCQACGHRYQCPNCSTWLVEHRFRRALVCHTCGHTERRPEACVACGSVDALVPCGPGVERLGEEVASRFPGRRSLVLSSDFPGGTERLRRELAAIAAGDWDIVIGTQLVAKGHNFPNMTLVGIIDADLGLANGDPRAGERTFQLLQQVAGRAGRGERPGRALLQTHQPDHPVMRALLSGDADGFYAQETAMREAAGLPPFGRLAALVVSAAEKADADRHARHLSRCADPPRGVVVFGPADAPIALMRGRHRVRLLVKAERTVDVPGYLRDWLMRAGRPRGNVRVQVDVDPMSFV